MIEKVVRLTWATGSTGIERMGEGLSFLRNRGVYSGENVGISGDHPAEGGAFRVAEGAPGGGFEVRQFPTDGLRQLVTFWQESDDFPTPIVGMGISRG